MLKYFLTCCLVLINVAWCFGQQSPDELQPAQLRVAALRNELPELIKGVDEPTLRVFLRLRVAAFLWTRGTKDDVDLASNLTTEALAELKEGGVPDPFANWLRANLQALLESHAPAMAARLRDKAGGNDRPEQVDSSASSASDAGGSSAVENIYHSLRNGQDPGTSFLFFLAGLERERPAEFVQLLSTVLAFEEQKTGIFSLETLSRAAGFFLRETNPKALKLRFLIVTVRATRIGNIPPDQLLDAYDLLRFTLPVMEKIAPPLYLVASTQMVTIGMSIPRRTLDRTAINNRINQSANPLDQLIAEAHASGNEPFRDELLTEAAQLAMKNGQLKLAVDLAAETSDEVEQGLWRDHFLGEAVEKAVAMKNPAVAEYAAPKIQSPILRASAIRRMADYFFDSKDVARSREAMADAVKLIEASKNDAHKASSLLEIATTYTRIDGAQAAETLQAAIKIIDSLPSPTPEDKPARKSYLDDQIQLSSNLIFVFRSFAEKDEISALSLSDRIQSKAAKASATLGISMGLSQQAKI